MPAGTVFLDTTVFADRFFGGRDARREIDSAISGHTVKSSGYVREQFRATFLRAAVMVHNALRTTPDPAEVLLQTDHFAFFQKGEGVKARKVLSNLLRHQNSNAEAMLVTLQRLVEFDLMSSFDRLATLTDDTKCCQCPDDPKADDNGIYRFSKKCTLDDPRPCAIKEFWQKRQVALTVLAAQPTAHPEKTRKAAAEVVQGKPARGQRCFVHLSDAVIVAEAEPNSTLLTSNTVDFNPIAEAFGEGRTVVGYKTP